MVFEKNVDGIITIFEDEYNSRMRYSSNIREKKEFKENYFTKEDQFMDENRKLTPLPKPISNPNPKKVSLWDKITGKNKK